MVTIQSKIKGSLYGFAIGDAMGATTEFLNEEQSKENMARFVILLEEDGFI